MSVEITISKRTIELTVNERVVEIAKGWGAELDSVQPPSYTVATLPSATVVGIIYVSDETGGAVLAFSDGTNWRRVTDRAIVS